MLKQFTHNNNRLDINPATHKILLAVSGGIDSVIMLDLFAKLDYKVAIIHCNFNLRGDESDKDEALVKELSAKYEIEFYSKSFDTKGYAAENGISIQMAARELRYNYFEEIRSSKGFDFVAIAHNKNDVVETFMINLIRGTGIKGLTGIKEKSGKIIRPLLFASRSEIETYCTKNQLTYREDSSNRQTKYTRNKLRHNIIPQIEEINPSFINTILENIDRFTETEKIYDDFIITHSENCFVKSQKQKLIKISELQKAVSPQSILFELLKPYGFSNDTIREISLSINRQSGKVFFSNSHRITKDRDVLIINKIENNTSIEIEIDEATKSVDLNPNQRLSISKFKKDGNFKLKKSPTIAYIDYDKLDFPLRIRSWKHADYFFPLGMTGKKKLSDFFVDQKLSIPEKENIRILTSGNKIAWIIGMRIDNRFKINDLTQNVLKMELNQESEK